MSSHQRFESNTDAYARFRPNYPDAMVRKLSARIEVVPAPTDSPVFDVGSGTGIFTRQLAEHLPLSVPVVGIEPAQAMRETARQMQGSGNISYRDGFANALPVADAGARAVLAATAAHWFERPSFYVEARRALVPSGVLAIIEYVRDLEHSPAAAAVQEFLDVHGEGRAYARPSYVDELNALDGFGPVEETCERVTMHLLIADFVGLALSSSHARPVVAKLGLDGARQALADIGGKLAGDEGKVPFGYLFQLFVVERR